MISISKLIIQLTPRVHLNGKELVWLVKKRYRLIKLLPWPSCGIKVMIQMSLALIRA